MKKRTKKIIKTILIILVIFVWGIFNAIGKVSRFIAMNLLKLEYKIRTWSEK